MNDLKSQAPTLFGSVIRNPPPVGIVEFAGGCSAGCSGVFWGEVSDFTRACKFVVPSRCTVFIQNSLSVDWLGLTVLNAVAFVTDDAVLIIPGWYVCASVL